MAANPAKCPGCDAGIFIHRFELCIDIIREVCKAAALYRLHDHQRNSKLFCQSVAFIPCLLLGVHVVILNLAEIPVTAAQHFFKCLVGIVEGKAQITDFALCL